MYHAANGFLVELQRLNKKGVALANPSVVQINGEDYLHVEIVRHDENTGDLIVNGVWEVKKSDVVECYTEHKLFQTFVKAAYLAITGVAIE
jgi:hypothetical protein